MKAGSAISVYEQSLVRCRACGDDGEAFFAEFLRRLKFSGWPAERLLSQDNSAQYAQLKRLFFLLANCFATSDQISGPLTRDQAVGGGRAVVDLQAWDHWQDCLLGVVRDFDGECTAAVVAAWQQVFAPGLATIKELHMNLADGAAGARPDDHAVASGGLRKLH